MKVMRQQRAMLQTLFRRGRSAGGTSGIVKRHAQTSPAQREGFGSFHSEDIENLLRQGADQYMPPEVHGVISSSVLTPSLMARLGEVEFGSKMCKELLFSLDPSWTFLNHGAFGAALKPLLLEAAAWRMHAEAQPLRFHDRQLLPLLALSVRSMAAHLGCAPTQLLPLPNVTSGLNAILASLEPSLRRGDTLVCTTLTYGATKKMLTALALRTGATLVVLPLRLPLSAASALADFQAQLVPHCLSSPRLVVIDSVTSNTALSLPVTSIAQHIRRAYPTAGSSSPVIVVDAAHSLHSDPLLSLSPPSAGGELHGGADFWLSNGHKWLCMPKGAAFCWLSERMRAWLRPAIVSHGFDLEGAPGARLHSAFVWDGCRDYAAMLTAPSALRIWSLLPPSHAYTAPLLHQATALLLDEWRTHGARLQAEDEGGETRHPAPPMSLIPLPAVVNGVSTSGCTDVEAFRLQEWLHHVHRIEVPVKCIQGRLFVRLSAHIYNRLADYQHLAAAVRGE